MYINALGNENNDTRLNAIKGLSEMGEPAVEPLIKLLNDKDNPPNVRSDAAIILGKIGNSIAIEPLINAMTEAKVKFDTDNLVHHHVTIVG